MNSKIDWKKIDKKIIKKIKNLIPQNKFLDLEFDSINNSFFYYINSERCPVGCLSCLKDEISQNYFGDIKIGEITLLNCKDLIDKNIISIDNQISIEMSPNVWLCPNCGRWIFDFLPKYDTIKQARS